MFVDDIVIFSFSKSEPSCVKKILSNKITNALRFFEKMTYDSGTINNNNVSRSKKLIKCLFHIGFCSNFLIKAVLVCLKRNVVSTLDDEY